MKKYIIIDTWNGEGYSESDVEILGFENDEAAAKFCEEKANETAAGFNNSLVRKYKESFIYEQLDEDDECENAGAYHYLLWEENIIAISLDPCINDFEVYTDQKTLDDSIDFAYINGEFSDEEEQEEFRLGNTEGIYVHSGGQSGDAVFFHFSTQDYLEFLESGSNNTEEEVWKDKFTGELYIVPIEIIRDFSNATKL